MCSEELSGVRKTVSDRAAVLGGRKGPREVVFEQRSYRKRETAVRDSWEKSILGRGVGSSCSAKNGDLFRQIHTSVSSYPLSSPSGGPNSSSHSTCLEFLFCYKPVLLPPIPVIRATVLLITPTGLSGAV